jgi:hypothetical protein
LNVSAVQGASPWTIQGDSASGASKAGNPVQVGGVFNTTQPTVTNGQTVEAQSTARGALIVSTGVDNFNINNIAGTISLPTGAATSANQITLGSQTTKINDGTNTAAVKAASTAPLATDPALVVTMSPNAGMSTSALQTTANTSLSTIATNTTLLAQGSTTSGQGGNLMMGAVTTAGPTYVTGQTSPLSLTTQGAQRVDTKSVRTFSAPTAAIVNTTSTLILAANTSRKGLYLSNTTGNQQVSFGFDGNAAVYQNGLTLYPGEKFWMDEYSFSTGAIYAITITATTYIGIQEIT